MLFIKDLQGNPIINEKKGRLYIASITYFGGYYYDIIVKKNNKKTNIDIHPMSSDLGPQDETALNEQVIEMNRGGREERRLTREHYRDF